MNRRRLLSILPVLPLAVLAPTAHADAAAPDMRIVFKRSEYVFVMHGGINCRACGQYHGPYYVMDCMAQHPCAFPRELAENSFPASRIVPADARGIPLDIPDMPCALSGWVGPHEHPDWPFRWVA